VSSATRARASVSLPAICSRLETAFSTGFQRRRAKVSTSKDLLHFHAGPHQPKLVLPPRGAALPRRHLAGAFLYRPAHVENSAGLRWPYEGWLSILSALTMTWF
jgi:hypothetical protein